MNIKHFRYVFYLVKNLVIDFLTIQFIVWYLMQYDHLPYVKEGNRTYILTLIFVSACICSLSSLHFCLH